MRRLLLLALLLSPGCSAAAPKRPEGPVVNVILWFDTEDYLLPASDDAALRNAQFLSGEGIRATFKVVGEKARVLERRGRNDVIAALKKHEIGYHSNFHSVHPTPAQYLSTLGWDEGVAEFERREGPGVEDLRRIFGVNPSCYGQPGSSWGPQAFGAMKKWGMGSYLDSGSHVALDGKPHYYCGLLTMFRLTHTLRTGLAKAEDLDVAKEKFRKSHEQLTKEGGGLVSIFYHPCEFEHREFWDSIFKGGKNPLPEEWTAPGRKTPEESRVAYENFEAWIRYLKTFPGVRFITASEAARIYRDAARGRSFDAAEVREIAAAVGDDVTFQRRGPVALSASEIFALLVASASGRPATLDDTPLGPTDPVAPLAEPLTTSGGQFARSIAEVDAFLRRHGRIPPTIWLGSAGVPPEAWLAALARTLPAIRDGRMPAQVEIRPATLSCGKRVADDSVKLWGWLFPEGFRAPAMMDLARRQSWTIKPAFASAD